MNTHEKVMEAVHNHHFNEDGNGINELIAYAYYLGRCEVAKEVCDKASKIFAEQLRQADCCRFKHMARYIQGNHTKIYHGDYDQWIRMFSNDKIKI